MAITGRLDADFAAFYTACENAVGHLKELESGSGRVQTAIEDVPPGIQRIADETREATTAQGSLGESVKSVALAFVSMATARAAFNFVKSTMDEAGALVDLSQQTHVSTDELQVLAGAMSEFGVDADTLGKGLFTLSRKVAGDDTSVANALHTMGMSLVDIKGLEGKELFLKMESGLAKLQGSLRDTTASELYGSKLGMAMAGASEGIEGAIDTWQKYNTVVSGESLTAMDQYAESVARAEKNLTSMAANMIGPVAQGINTLYDASTKGAGGWQILNAVLDDTTAMITGRGSGTEHLTRLLDDQNKVIEDGAAKQKAANAVGGEATVILTEQGKAAAFMAALQKDAAGVIEPFQLMHLAHLKEIGKLDAANAAGIGVSATQFAKYTAEVTAAEAAQKALDAAAKAQKAAEQRGLLEVGKLWTDYAAARIAHGGTANQIAMAEQEKWAADLTEKMRAAGTDSADFYKAMAAHSAEFQRSSGVDWNLINSTSRDAQWEMADNAQKTLDVMLNGSREFSRDSIDAQRDRVEELRDSARGLGPDYEDSFERAAAAAQIVSDKLKQIQADAKAAAEKLRAMGGSMTYDLSTDEGMAKFRQLNPGAAINVGKEYFDKHTLEDAVRAGLIDLYAGFRKSPGFAFAGGVSDFQGGLALVGERGPELVNLPKGSDVLPAGSFGGGSTIVQNTFHIVDTESNIARRVSDTIMRSVLQGQKLRTA